jgi:hypothetical protein
MLYVHVFVGSPNDVVSFRDVVLSTIEQMRQDLVVDEIAIAGEDWRLVAGDLGEPQWVINLEIAKANLLILIIGERLGEGTRKELDFAWSFPGDGRLQSLMIYFQTMPPAMLAAPSPEAREVIAERKRWEGKALYHEFANEAELQGLVRAHLIRWLAPLRNLRRFQNTYGTNLDLWLTRALNVPNPPPNDEVVPLETIPWDRELPDGNDVYDYRRYLASPDGRPYDVDMLACYRIARYLFRQVLRENTSEFRERPFTTFIHRYLSDHVRRACEQRDPLGEQYLRVLHRWLAARNNVFLNARSFAAYQIGMCRDRSGRDVLLAALRDASEAEDVRRYAALALGMTWSRDVIEALVEVHDRTATPSPLRRAIGHAILAVAGLLPPSR